MYKGPFSIAVSDRAERIDLTALPDAERQLMTHGIHFSPDKHEAFRFFVVPQIEVLSRKPHRTIHDVSFEKVNRVLIDIRASGADVQFLGMFPTTLTADGRWELDLSGEALLNVVVPGAAALKLTALAKNLVRRKTRPSIKAHRTNQVAQWIFFKEWLDKGADFRMQIVCVVDRSAAPDARQMTCNAKFADDGRLIKKVDNKVIRFPAA